MTGKVLSRAEALTSRPELRELQAAGIALLLSIEIGSVLILIVGKSPAHVWWAMVSRTANDPYQLGLAL